MISIAGGAVLKINSLNEHFGTENNKNNFINLLIH